MFTLSLNFKKAIVFGLLFSLFSNAFAQEKPNILLLIAEDINPYLGCYGDKTAKSPTIDSLAEEGIRFDAMYSPNGVCAPSRSALMTGMFPTSVGTNHMRTGGGPLAHPYRMPSYQVILPEGMKAFTEYMRAEGYFCTNNRKTDYQFKNQLSFWDESSNKATWENRPDDQPFFSVFTYLESHESKLWESKDDSLLIKPEEVTPPPYLLQDSIGKRDFAIMYNNIYRMDKRVASEIAKIKKAGLLDNTIIIFMSDNGGPMPRQKRSLYERGTRIPFIVVFPDGRQAGTVDDRMLNMADIPPTILSLAGIEPPDHMDGKAFLGEYSENRGRGYVFSIRERMDADYDKQITVRDKEYRYVRNYLPHQPEYLDIGYRLNLASMRKMLEVKNDLNKEQASWFTYPRPKEELYHTAQDPHEMNNLAGNAKYEGKLEEMGKLADKVEEEYWPYKELTEYELIEQIGNTGNIQVAKPSIKLTGNSVSLTSQTVGASFVYQINGDGNMNSHWTYYTGPISLEKGDNLKVVGTRAGFEQSEMQEYFSINSN